MCLPMKLSAYKAIPEIQCSTPQHQHLLQTMSDKPPPPGCQGGSQDIRNRRLPSQPASQPARAFVTEDYTATATTRHHSPARGTASCSCGHVLRTMFAIPKEFKLHQSKSEHIWINSTFAKHRHKQEHICLVFFYGF